MVTPKVLTGSQVFDFGWPDVPGSCKQMSGQALFWSVHHWSVCCQNTINSIPRKQNLTFGCVAHGAGVYRLAESKLGEACDGNRNEGAEMHLDFDDVGGINAIV